MSESREGKWGSEQGVSLSRAKQAHTKTDGRKGRQTVQQGRQGRQAGRQAHAVVSDSCAQVGGDDDDSSSGNNGRRRSEHCVETDDHEGLGKIYTHWCVGVYTQARGESLTID
jgi:hypothetical protein